MAKLSKAQRECVEAYNSFERDRIIYGLKITCIPEPPKRYKIANFGLPEEDRVFKTIELPKIITVEDDKENIVLSYFKGMTTKEQAEAIADGVDGADIGEKEKEFILKLYEYRTKGYFFYNKDKLEYITGDHWYMLNALKIDTVATVNGIITRVEGSPKFIDAQRDVFLHWQQCVIDRSCYGQMLITRRRFAKTTIGTSILLNNATITPRSRNGIQAQNRDGAKDIFDKVVDMWRKLPKHPFFYPTHAGEDNPASRLEFREPRKRSKNSKYAIQEEVLESWVDFRATKPQAYDGSGLSRYYLDEASKIEECNLIELFNVVRETLAIGTVIAGKMLVTSTAENIGGKTLEQFKQLWDESAMRTKENSPLNMTASGLHQLFIPADYGYIHDFDEDGDLPDEYKKPTVDRWGYSDKDQARKVILAARKNKTGSSLIQFIRKYPLTVEEAFTFGISASPLPLEKIQQQRIYNQQLFMVDDPIKRGTFVWDYDKTLPQVRFVEKDDGLVYLNPRIKPEDLNQITRGLNGLTPTRNMCHTGVDPFDHKSTEGGGFSKGAAVTICNDPKYFKKPCVVAVYHGRPADPKIFYEDIIKMCVYFSSYAYIENQKPGCVNHFVDEGYMGYLGDDAFNTNSKTVGISMRDLKKRSILVDRMISYVNDNVGVLDEANQVYSDHYFDFLLRDWYNFNPDGEAWTKYDLSVATLLALIGLEKPHYTPPQYKLSDFF